MASLEQTLRNAIEATRAAERFYALLADSTHDATASAFLRGLAVREAAHGQAVGVMALEITEHPLPPHAEAFVDGARVDAGWRSVDDVTFPQAVQVAIDAGLHAGLLYEALADSSPPAARRLLTVLARQQEAHVALLERLRKSPKARLRWQPRSIASSEFPQALRDMVMAEHAAARHHAMVARVASDRPTRVFLQRLAADEQAVADELDVIGFEAFDNGFPARARPQASSMKLFPELALPSPVDLHMALEYGLLSQILGASLHGQLASQAPVSVAPALARVAAEQREQANTLAMRCDSYQRSGPGEVRSVPPHELQYILEDWWKPDGS